MVSLSLNERVTPEEEEQPVSERDEGLSSADASMLARLLVQASAEPDDLGENP
jgi:hypothetical protein